MGPSEQPFASHHYFFWVATKCRRRKSENKSLNSLYRPYLLTTLIHLPLSFLIFTVSFCLVFNKFHVVYAKNVMRRPAVLHSHSVVTSAFESAVYHDVRLGVRKVPGSNPPIAFLHVHSNIGSQHSESGTAVRSEQNALKNDDAPTHQLVESNAGVSDLRNGSSSRRRRRRVNGFVPGGITGIPGDDPQAIEDELGSYPVTIVPKKLNISATELQHLRQKQWILAIQDSLPGGSKYNASEAIENTESTVWKHPVRGRYPGLLWKYQFVCIVLMMIGVFSFQLILDTKARKRCLPVTRISTCLLLGANFRGLGETNYALAARFLTCAFLHIHAVHLFGNVTCIVFSWIMFSSLETVPLSIAPPVEVWWFYHWTFPIFMVTAFCGSCLSYFTTLKTAGFSIGASGGCLGLSTGYLTATFLLAHNPVLQIPWMIFSGVTVLLSCFPLDYCCVPSGDRPDIGAHIMGSLSGIIIAMAICFGARVVELKLFALVADCFSAVLLILLVLAYAEIIMEYRVSGRDLVIRAFIKWLQLEEIDDGDVKRRNTAPGRVECDKLTKEFLDTLQRELEDEQDLNAVLQRIDQEAVGTRKSLPEMGGRVY